jgi:glucose-6-phosphate dehydrogenase assembly protein OpcA
MPFGRRRQICCEQIEISASDGSLPDLPAVILPLAVPDLPVILWCRGARLFALPDFAQLAGIAHKLLLDSAVFPDAATAVARVEERVHSGQVLGDLTWTRLTRWRELVSQMFESRVYQARLREISEVRVGFGGDLPPSGAYYLSAWLLNCLENVGAVAQVNWEPALDAPAGRLASVELLGATGGLRASISVTGDRGRQSAVTRVDTIAQRTVFAPENDYVLLREELSIPGRDPVYEKSLARAARLARPEQR